MRRIPVFGSPRYHRQLAGCRVCRLVAATVFVAIVAIEVAILLPSYANERARILDEMAQQARAFAEGARRGVGLAVAQNALPAGVTGVRLLDPQGRPVAVLGQLAEASPAAADAIPAPPQTLPDGWTVESRIDAELVAARMQAFILRIAGLVLLIAAVTTIAAMLVMGHTVLAPLLLIEQALAAAARSPSRTAFEPVELPRYGELRSMGETVNQLFAELAHFNRTEQLRNSLTDPLTGLYNRPGLWSKLADPDGGGAAPSGWTLFLLDIDGFSKLNARQGHEGGDRILRAVGERLFAAAAEGEVVARTLGDEFVLATRAEMGPSEVAAMASRLLSELSAPIALEARDLTLSLSCAASLAGREPADEARLQALRLVVRRAKADGGGRVRFLDAPLDALAKRRRRLERALRGAFERGEIHVVYQPKVCLQTGALCGAEALARWHLRGKEEVSPAEFVPICEDIGLIDELGRHVMRRVLADISAWRAEGLSPPKVAVNVSARQFQDPGLVNFVADLLAEAGTPEKALGGEALEIEITESAFIGDTRHAVEQLRRLGEIGVTAAIDDFGTGYSALSYLRNLPVATLKIDRAFVSGIDTDEGARRIADTIVALGSRLGFETVAEGVETPRQAALLAAAGCRLAQGYLFSRPLAPEVYRAKLQAAAAGEPLALISAA